MTDLQGFVDQAWTDHADDAAGVAQRQPQALDAVRSEAELMDLARLAHHVHGAHLGAWADALGFLTALAQAPAFEAAGASGRALRCWRASLHLAAGDRDPRQALAVDERITVSAQAAACMALHDGVRARQLLQQTFDLSEATPLAASDPALRSLAAHANGIAVALEVEPERSEAERELMLLAAETARCYWQMADSWLQVERAEDRLAMSWLAAGDAARARQHALACLAIVDAQAEPPALETFFGQ